MIGSLLLLDCSAEAPTSAPPNIIVYLVDTLRLDHLGVYGYSRDPAPRLSAFAADAVRFDSAFSPSSWTRPAVASLLSGVLPAQHGARTRLDKLAPDVRLIGEYLRPAGYQSAAFASNVNVLPLWGFGRGFDRFVDVDSEDRDSHSDEITDALFAFLDEAARPPFFLYIHTRDPHKPYRPPPPYDERWPAEAPPDATNRPDAPRPAWAIDEIRRYDGEVSFNDEQFGRLLDRLKADGLYRDSLIVFTSDHGEEFLERGVWGHGQSLFGEVVRVPLLIKLPGNRHAGSVRSQRTSLLDLMPTLLAAAGVEQPEQLVGIDLHEVIERERNAGLDDRAMFFDLDLVGKAGERTVSSAVIAGPYKLIERDEPKREVGLWNLERDPHELENLAGELPDVREALSERLAAYRDTDDSEIQLWVTGPRGSRATGTLRTAGRFERVRGPEHEAGDRVILERAGDRITFEFALDPNVGAGASDRDGIVFGVFPPQSEVHLENFRIDDRPAPVFLGRNRAPAGDLPIAIDTTSALLSIDRADELFSGEAVPQASARIGFVSRARGELSDLSDPIARRLRALGYIE